MTTKTLRVYIALIAIPYIVGAMAVYLGPNWFTVPTIALLVFGFFACIGHLINLTVKG